MKTSSPPSRDSIKALILERQKAYHKTDEWMAAQLQISTRTFYRLMNERHTEEWPLKYIRKLCWALNVTPEQFAASLTNGRR